MINILTEFNNAGFIKDRLPSDTFELPYSIEQIKIQPNELAAASTFNIKLDKLYNNFLYLYGLCFMAGFDSSNNVKGVFDEVNGYIPSIAPIFKQYLQKPFSLTKTYALSSSKKAISFFSSKSNTFQTVFTSKNALGVLSLRRGLENIGTGIIQSYTGGVVFTQTSVDPISGSINFLDIGGIAQCNNTYLFLTDAKYNNIYSYNLEGAISDDNIEKNVFFQQNIVGGKGTINDKIKFNQPTAIVDVDEHILVVDSQNNCFKIFDLNLNWVSTSPQALFFKQYPGSSIKKIIYHNQTKQLIVATIKAIHVFKVNTLFNIVYDKTVETVVNLSEEIVDINFATYDSHILFVVTTQTIYKKWLSKIDKNIHLLSNPLGLNTNFQWATVAPLDKNTTMLLARISDQSLSSSFLLIIEDSIDMLSLLKNNNFEIYSKEDVFLNKNEVICSWTYNKCFKKLLYNLNLLVTNVIYRFYTKENSDLKSIAFTYKTYNNLVLNKSIKDTNKSVNIFINELFQAESLNRCLTQLYEYQEYILAYLINNQPINVDLTPNRLK